MLYVTYIPKFLYIPTHKGKNHIDQEIINNFISFYPFASVSEDVDYDEFINCASQFYYFLMSQYSDCNGVDFIFYNPFKMVKEQNWFNELKNKNNHNDQCNILLLGNGDGKIFHRVFKFYNFIKSTNEYFTVDQYYNYDFFKQNSVLGSVCSSLTAKGDDCFYNSKSIFTVLEGFLLQECFDLRLRNLYNGKVYFLNLTNVNVDDINHELLVNIGMKEDLNKFNDYDDVFLIENNIIFNKIYDILIIDSNIVICSNTDNTNEELLLEYVNDIFKLIDDKFKADIFVNKYTFLMRVALIENNQFTMVGLESVRDLSFIKDVSKMRKVIESFVIYSNSF